MCDFVAYSIIHPRYKQLEQYKLLEKHGFKIPVNKMVTNLSSEILSKYLIERREQSIYDIDGIVVTDNSAIYEHPTNKDNPDFAFAFKMQMNDQIAIATVKSVIWNVSKDGYLKPKIEITPVELAGTTITFATAFNAKYVVDNKLGEGAQVKIIRSGDVIPHILEVIKQAKIVQMPNEKYVWTDTDVDIYIEDTSDNKMVTIKSLTFFLKTINAKHISEGVVTKFVEAKIDTIEKILESEYSDFKLVDGIGEKSFQKIMDSIHEGIKNAELQTLMAASGIFGRGLGERKLKEILNKYPTIMSDKLSNKELMNNILEVDGFSDTLATKFCENLNEFKIFFDNLSSIIDLSHMIAKKEIKKDNKYAGKIFVFSGFRDKELETMIVNNGGKVSSSVSKNTTYLIVADKNETSGKIKNAQDNNVPILSRDEFIKL